MAQKIIVIPILNGPTAVIYNGLTTCTLTTIGCCNDRASGCVHSREWRAVPELIDIIECAIKLSKLTLQSLFLPQQTILPGRTRGLNPVFVPSEYREAIGMIKQLRIRIIQSIKKHFTILFISSEGTVKFWRLCMLSAQWMIIEDCIIITWTKFPHFISLRLWIQYLLNAYTGSSWLDSLTIMCMCSPMSGVSLLNLHDNPLMLSILA